MNLKIVLIFGLVCLVALCSARPAEEEYAEYEDEPAPPPPKKAPARSSLIGRRNPIAGRSSKATSTTTIASPAEAEEETAAEEEAGEEHQDASSTTETPKKFLKTGVVRPFRSNDDLLATLKRRREQAASNKVSKVSHATEAEESAPAVHNEPAPKASRPSTSGRRNRFSKNNKDEATAPAEEPSSTAAPARTGRRFSSRS